jgi:hypothetical protein
VVPADRGGYEPAGEDVACGEDQRCAKEQKPAGLLRLAITPEQGDRPGTQHCCHQSGQSRFRGKTKAEEIGVLIIGADHPCRRQRNSTRNQQHTGIGKEGSLAKREEDGISQRQGQRPQQDIQEHPFDPPDIGRLTLHDLLPGRRCLSLARAQDLPVRLINRQKWRIWPHVREASTKQ